MKYFKYSNWGIVKAYNDIENFLDWRRTIIREKNNPKSKYSKWKLSHTKLYDIYTVVTLDQQYATLPNEIQRTQLVEMLNPLHIYLDEDLGFAECLNCEFNQYMDDKNAPTLSYLIVYRFNFNKLSFLWIIKMLSLIAILSYSIYNFNTIYAWLSSLI